MKRETQDKLQALQQHMQRAGDELDFEALAEGMIDLLWLIAEERPDFQELPAWLASKEAAMRRAGKDFDTVSVFGDFADLCRSVAERYAAGPNSPALANDLKQLAVKGRNLDTVSIGALIVGIGTALLCCSAGAKRLPVVIMKDNVIRIGRHTTISLNRTLRIPEDGLDYPLPAGFGRLPVCRVEEYADKVPAKWLEEGGFFVPLYQREALFLEFGGEAWRPTIVKVAVGKINAITGKEYDEKIRAHSQDYVVVPDQKWLDGINSNEGRVGQFVAMPLGKGYTVEEQITDEAKFGGFQVVAFDPKAGRFPNEDPAVVKQRERKARNRAIRVAQDQIIARMPVRQREVVEACRTHYSGWGKRLEELGINEVERDRLLDDAKRILKEKMGSDGLLGFEEDRWTLRAQAQTGDAPLLAAQPQTLAAQPQSPRLNLRGVFPETLDELLEMLDAENGDIEEMGIAKGGSIKQEILEDTYGTDSWDEDAKGFVFIHIVNSEVFERITGLKAPPSPITPEKYAKYKIPWFDAYDEYAPALVPARAFQQVKGIAALDKGKGTVIRNEHQSIEVPPERILRIKTPNLAERVCILAQQAEVSWKSKRYKVAHRECTYLLDLQRNHTRALEIRTDCNNKLDRYLDAEADASECLEKQPGNVSALRSRAFANLRLGEHELALEDATAALTSDPSNIYSLRVRAEANFRLQLYDEAISDASCILKAIPNNPTGLQLRAECYRLKGMYLEAMQEATAALIHGGPNIFGLNTRAAAFIELGNPYDARQDAEEVLRMDPENAFARGIIERLPARKPR